MARWSFVFALCMGCASSSIYEGVWSGVINGHANFDASWAEEPYCTGGLAGGVSAEGNLALVGTCTITWGPAQGAEFDVVLTGGTPDDATLTFGATFTHDPEEERDITDIVISDVMSDPFSGQADAEYYSAQLGNPVEAFVAVELWSEGPE